MTFSGRITGFAVPRGQSTKYYVLTASSGVWKTEDAGISFEPIFEKGGTLSTGWLAIAPSDPNILYLGTGEPMHARSSTHGNGVWKSTDAGKTWTKAGLEKSYFINKIEVDSKNPDIVYVAAEGKLYDNEMDCERGLFKTERRRQDLDEPRPDEGPRRGRRRHRPAQLRHRHHRVVQDLPPRVDVHRPAARQRALQEHRRRQDLEEAGSAAFRRTWRWAAPGSRSSRRTRTSSTRGSTRK